jgi:hypothetical protein
LKFTCIEHDGPFSDHHRFSFNLGDNWTARLNKYAIKTAKFSSPARWVQKKYSYKLEATKNEKKLILNGFCSSMTYLFVKFPKRSEHQFTINHTSAFCQLLIIIMAVFCCCFELEIQFIFYVVSFYGLACDYDYL